MPLRISPSLLVILTSPFPIMPSWSHTGLKYIPWIDSPFPSSLLFLAEIENIIPFIFFCAESEATPSGTDSLFTGLSVRRIIISSKRGRAAACLISTTLPSTVSVPFALSPASAVSGKQQQASKRIRKRERI